MESCTVALCLGFFLVTGIGLTHGCRNELKECTASLQEQQTLDKHERCQLLHAARDCLTKLRSICQGKSKQEVKEWMRELDDCGPTESGLVSATAAPSTAATENETNAVSVPATKAETNAVSVSATETETNAVSVPATETMAVSVPDQQHGIELPSGTTLSSDIHTCTVNEYLHCSVRFGDDEDCKKFECIQKVKKECKRKGFEEFYNYGETRDFYDVIRVKCGCSNVKPSLILFLGTLLIMMAIRSH